MGKLFVCEYCDKKFKDVIEVRKLHLNSVRHQEARLLYYSQFKDPLSKLQDASNKLPCKWFEKGICKYGDNCQLSHLTKSEFEKLKLEVLNHQLNQVVNFSNETDFQSIADDWVLKNMQHALIQSNEELTLPPSLKLTYS